MSTVQEALEQSLRQLIVSSQDSISRSNALLRRFNDTDPDGFACAGASLLVTDPVCREHRHLGLLLSNNPKTRSLLIQPNGLPLADALIVAKAVQNSNTAFDITLADSIAGNDEDLPELTVVERTLQILDAISDGPRLVRRIARLVQHPDRRIASKAAVFVGRRVQNHSWTEKNLGHLDGRVRANVIESLWGIDSPDSRAILRRYTQDPSNRVAGNALYGLYTLGDTGMIPIVCRLSRDPQLHPRATAAWVMGQTGDPRFRTDLARLIGDPSAVVRSRALKSLQQIKDNLNRLSAAGRVKILPMPSGSPGAGSFRLHLQVLDEQERAVGNLLPTQFVVSLAGSPVEDYTVEERISSEGSRNVVCLALGLDNEASQIMVVRSLHRHLTERKRREAWHLYAVKPKPREELKFSWQQAVETGHRERVVEPSASAALAGLAFAPLDHDLSARAIAELLSPLTRQPGERRLLLLLKGEPPGEAQRQAILEIGNRSKTAVYAILVDDFSAAEDFRTICEKTGGLCFSAGEAAIASGMEAVFRGMSHRYDVTFPWPQSVGERAACEIQILSPEGVGELTIEAAIGASTQH